MPNLGDAWRPTAGPGVLDARAAMLAAARDFFAARGVLEVDTPVLGAAGVTDPAIENLVCRPAAAPARAWFLQSSPEFYMKRLLAAGAPDIYQIGKVFRDGESGRFHLPEFTLIEWYRRGLGLDGMATETAALVVTLAGAAGGTVAAPTTLDYAEAFRAATGLDPHEADVPALRDWARRALGETSAAALVRTLAADRAAWIDLAASHALAPSLPGGLVVLSRYPAVQAALARLAPDDRRVAERFELFWDGLEIANGYVELSDPGEQRLRFARDAADREARALPPRGADAALLAALDAGLPDCAGVAVGFDRVLMRARGLDDIRLAVPFADCGG